MIDTIKTDAEQRMKKAVEALQHEMSKIRTGRANSGLLDHVQVDYYGNPTPLNQVASVSLSDSRTLLVTPFDKSMVAAIEKAILNADLGLNPSAMGRGEAEQGKVSVRNIRRDVLQKLKEIKTVSEDDERRATDLIQKITDKYIADMDLILAQKEKDLLEI